MMYEETQDNTSRYILDSNSNQIRDTLAVTYIIKVKSVHSLLEIATRIPEFQISLTRTCT